MAKSRLGAPDQSDNSAVWYVYTGSSMYPTLRELDLFEVLPLAGRAVKPGDVILFHLEDQSRAIVHRAIQLATGGIHTQGDHNTAIDDDIVLPENVIGRVVRIHRGRKMLPIASGCLWRTRLAIHKMLIALYSWVAMRVRPSLVTMRAACARFLAGWLQPKIVRYTTPAGTITRMLLRHTVIGQYDPASRRWRIKAPYRLFIDENNSPS